MLNIKRGDCQGAKNSQYIIMLITITAYHGCHYTVFAYKTLLLIFLISDFVCLWQAGQLQWELQQLPGFSLHTNDSNFWTSYYYCINIFIQISTWFVIFGSQQRKQILYVKTYNDGTKVLAFWTRLLRHSN